MPNDNVTPFRVINNPTPPTPPPAVEGATVTDIIKEVENMTPEAFAIFESVVTFANFLLENKYNIRHFVACVGMPGPEENQTGFAITTSPIESGDFALANLMLGRALQEHLT